MFEKNKTKKRIKTENFGSAKKVVGALQANYTKPVWEYLLHLPSGWTGWKQLANGTYVAQGECGCVFEIRLENTPTTVLQLQYKPRRNGGRLLLPNVKRNRAKRDGQITGRQKGISKSNGTLSQTN